MGIDLMAPREVHVADSKFLALILWHKPEEIGISLDEHGWADVDELVQGISRTRPFTRDMLEEIVTASSRATGRVGKTHRALPGKKSRCKQLRAPKGV